MDAKALLSAQGWRGKGHSLHATDDSIGLARPLMLSRKANKLGVGNQHFTSDQWWLNAFDEQVKGLDTSKEGRVVQTVTAGKLDTVGKGTGRYALYASFVRGGLLEGSIPKAEAECTSSSAESGAVTPVEQTESQTEKRPGETKEERRARRAARRLRKAEKLDRRKLKIQDDATQGSAEEAGKTKESKEERRVRKEAKRRSVK